MGNMICPVLNDTLKHYAEEDRRERKAEAIYEEASRLVKEETSEVLSQIYSDLPACARFESAVRKIATAFSSAHQMWAADDIADLMHEMAMEMATRKWERIHGMA